MTADLAELLAWAKGARSLLAATAVLALYVAFHGLTGSTPLFVVFVGATWAFELGWLIRRALIAKAEAAPQSSEEPTSRVRRAKPELSTQLWIPNGHPEAAQREMAERWP